jgi:dipeptide/tripeptide permease
MDITTAISPLYVAVVFLIASLIKMYQNQNEQAFSRFAITVWYFYIYFNVVSEATRSVVGRWMFMQLALLEVASFIMRLWMKREYKKALDGNVK